MSGNKDHNDSIISVETPEGIAFDIHPAGIMSRLCAHILDSLFQGLVILGLNAFLIFSLGMPGTWIMLLLVFAVNWFYHVFFELFNNGMSPGKKIMGLRVISSNGSPVGPGASFLRNILRFADSFFSLSLIGLLCISLSPGFRRLGDWAAGTLVVYRYGTFSSPGYTAWKQQDISAGHTGLYSFPYDEQQALLAFARRLPLLGSERAEEIARDYVEQLGLDMQEHKASHYINLLAGQLEGKKL